MYKSTWFVAGVDLFIFLTALGILLRKQAVPLGARGQTAMVRSPPHAMVLHQTKLLVQTTRRAQASTLETHVYQYARLATARLEEPAGLSLIAIQAAHSMEQMEAIWSALSIPAAVA
jgi:hypothetical protein